MEQKTEPLSDTLVEWLEAQRSWVRGHYHPEFHHLYDSIDGKLELLDAILQQGWADEDWKLEALGVAMGDLLVQKLDMCWIVEDGAFGKSLAVQIPTTNPNVSVFSYPIGMIQKRVEGREAFDVRELFEATCKILEDQAKDVSNPKPN